ncbi:MAG: hypothetical protein Q7R81_03910 [Candidatus Peregrinibacteria bacterium]|nr:hypothetical protein [Candidatus Peregrinibacteria bacterium]
MSTIASLPWLDLIGMFLALVGFSFGLGGVTIIDIHSFLGRNSPYWMEASIRTHKITKPLIWTGLACATVGSVILYRDETLSGTILVQALLLVLLAGNGAFLTFKISRPLLEQERLGKAAELLSPHLQRTIGACFLLSFVLWWSEAVLFTWHLVMRWVN